MNKRLDQVIVFACIVIICSACVKKPEKAASNAQLKPTSESKVHEVVAEEVLDAMSYNYVKVKDGNLKYWIAITKQPVEVGKTYFFEPEGLMIDFESKNLGRTFDSVYFVTKFSGQPFPDLTMSAHGGDPSERVKTTEQGNISVERAEGGITIEELYADRAMYADQEVVIRGKVVKYTMGILNTNWAHIQDGTNNSGNYDLTVTTDEIVNVGEVVTFKGKITLNKDFGHGYAYEILMEKAINFGKKTSI